MASRLHWAGICRSAGSIITGITALRRCQLRLRRTTLLTPIHTSFRSWGHMTVLTFLSSFPVRMTVSAGGIAQTLLPMLMAKVESIASPTGSSIPRSSHNSTDLKDLPGQLSTTFSTSLMVSIVTSSQKRRASTAWHCGHQEAEKLHTSMHTAISEDSLMRSERVSLPVAMLSSSGLLSVITVLAGSRITTQATTA